MTQETGSRPLRPTKAAAVKLNTSEATLNTWRSRGRGPKYVKIGGKVFYRDEDLDDFISKNVIDPTHVASSPSKPTRATGSSTCRLVTPNS
jgi:hypothetical protein